MFLMTIFGVFGFVDSCLYRAAYTSFLAIDLVLLEGFLLSFSFLGLAKPQVSSDDKL